MKQSLFPLLFCLPLLAAAQPETPPAPRPKGGRLSLGAVFSLDYGYRSLQAPATYDPLMEVRNRREVADIRHTAGISLLYRLNNRWTLETGLQRAERGYKTVTSLTPYPPPGMPAAVTTYYHYTFLDMPLKVNYNFVTGRCRLYAAAGLIPQCFLGGRTRVVQGYEDTRQQQRSSDMGLSPFLTASATAGVGMDYAMSPKVHARIEPLFRYSLDRIAAGPIEERLYSAGLNLGLFLRL